MSNKDIVDAIRFNADLIAQEIADAVYVQQYGTSEYEKKCAVTSAFWHIHELIFKGDDTDVDSI